MRHSSIDLTMNVHSDPKLLDVAGALDSLPELPLKKPIDKRSKSSSILIKRHAECSGEDAAAEIAVSSYPVITKKPLPIEDQRLSKSRGDWRSFESWIAAYVDAVLAPKS
jgi:hypothetical protein